MEKWFEERRKMSELRKDFDDYLEPQQIRNGGNFDEESVIHPQQSSPTDNLDAIDKITNVLRFEQFEPIEEEKLDGKGINVASAAKIMVDGRKSNSDSTMITRI